ARPVVVLRLSLSGPSADRQTEAMEALRCPNCELVFATRAELEAHLRDEHPGSVEAPPKL
ncbi:MAG: hypothetical protein V7636_2106, partial [Actinomycetota bacterium]